MPPNVFDSFRAVHKNRHILIFYCKDVLSFDIVTPLTNRGQYNDEVRERRSVSNKNLLV